MANYFEFQIHAFDTWSNGVIIYYRNLHVLENPKRPAEANENYNQFYMMALTAEINRYYLSVGCYKDIEKPSEWRSDVYNDVGWVTLYF